jgi:hypothetical protein
MLFFTQLNRYISYEFAAYERKGYTLGGVVGEYAPLLAVRFLRKPERAAPCLLDGEIVSHHSPATPLRGVPSSLGIRSKISAVACRS